MLADHCRQHLAAAQPLLPHLATVAARAAAAIPPEQTSSSPAPPLEPTADDTPVLRS